MPWCQKEIDQFPCSHIFCAGESDVLQCKKSELIKNIRLTALLYIVTSTLFQGTLSVAKPSIFFQPIILILFSGRNLGLRSSSNDSRYSLHFSNILLLLSVLASRQRCLSRYPTDTTSLRHCMAECRGWVHYCAVCSKRSAHSPHTLLYQHRGQIIRRCLCDHYHDL